jgi:hypothetical protein
MSYFPGEFAFLDVRVDCNDPQQAQGDSMSRFVKLTVLCAAMVTASMFVVPKSADAGYGYGYGYRPYVYNYYRPYVPVYKVYVPTYSYGYYGGYGY